MTIEIENVSKIYEQKGKHLKVLDQVSLSIPRGEFVCLLGPSGCGKTTLLNAVAGFESVTQGEITIDGQKVTGPSPEYVTIFQNYGLLPWRTVQQNVMLGLEARGLPKEEGAAIARDYIGRVGLEDFMHHHPGQLSGGMQQRVAIARALAVDPAILFMDEPFGALDAITRMKLQNDLLGIVKEKQKTVIFVTHDIEEAVYLADRIVVMSPHPGRIKTVVQVPLGRRRDRTATDFLRIRDQVFDIFEMKLPVKTEYFI